MKRRRKTQPRKLRKGASAVELAIMLPVLLLITFGCVDFARIGYFSMALSHGVSGGCDYAATYQFTSHTESNGINHIRELVVAEMQHVPGFDESDLSVSVLVEELPDGETSVTVSATYPFETIVSWPGIPQHTLLSHRLQARRYR